MRTLTSPEPEIDKTDPYGSDVFGDRKPFGEQLQHLIRSIHFEQEGLVLAIDASWGEGKTTFARMWMQALKNQGITPAYYDAFAEDNSTDPFLSFSSCLYDALGIQLFRFFSTKIIKISNQYLKSKTGIDLKNFFNRKKAVEELRTYLSSKAETIKEKNQGCSLIILIDELDRCRPDSALQLLERIKHIFSVPHIAFVLLINRRQLEEQVKARYGSGIDAENYLHKFIHLNLHLPKKESSDYRKYAERLWQEYSLQECFPVFHPPELGELKHDEDKVERRRSPNPYDEPYTVERKYYYYSSNISHCFFAELARFYQLSLREMERCCAYLALLAQLNFDQISIGTVTIEQKKQLALLLTVIKVKFPLLYDRLKNSGTNAVQNDKSLRLNDLWSLLTNLEKNYDKELEEDKKNHIKKRRCRPNGEFLFGVTSHYFTEYFHKITDLCPFLDQLRID